MSVGIDEDRWATAVHQQADRISELEQNAADAHALNRLLRRQLAAANDYIGELERQLAAR